MSSAPLQMDANLQDRAGKASMLIFAVPILVLLSDQTILNALLSGLVQVESTINSDSKEGVTTQRVMSYAIMAITAAAFMFAFLARTFSLHRKFDNWLPWLRAQKMVSGEMKGQIERKAKETNFAGCVCSKTRFRQVFYHFVNDQKELREMAFYYWENYFSLVTLSVFCAISSLCCLIYTSSNSTNVAGWCLTMVPIVLCLSSTFEARYLRTKLKSHLETQVDAFAKQRTTEFHKALSEMRNT